MKRFYSVATLLVLPLVLAACGPRDLPDPLTGEIIVSVAGVDSASVTISAVGYEETRTVTAAAPETFADLVPGVYTVTAAEQAGFVTPPPANVAVIAGQSHEVTLTFEPEPTTVTVALAGENEVPPVATTASGSATATLQGNTLSVEGSFQGLESDLVEIAGSAGHIHEGAVGENGPILFNLTIASDDNRSGTFVDTFELSDDQVDLFNDGLMYINIHTENNPGGELRGQLIADAPEFPDIDAAFDARLLPENEVHEVDSEASGTATSILRGDRLTVSGSFEGLGSDLVEVQGSPGHIHHAPVGENGPIVVNLDVSSEDMRSGSFSLSTALDPEHVAALMAGNLYLNIHTEEYGAGELRGQLFPRPAAPVAVETELAGANEVPPVETGATGSAAASLDGFELVVSGSFEGLESDLVDIQGSPGHIHEAPAGENGPIVFNLEVDADEDMRSGTFGLNELLSDQQRTAFIEGLYYVNIHTENNPGGELRGQLANIAVQY